MLLYASLDEELISQIRIFFLARSATDDNDSDQGLKHKNYHRGLKNIFEQIGFNVTSRSELNSLMSKPVQDYIYGVHSHAWFNGKEVFSSVLCEYYGLAYLGPRPTVRAVSEDKRLLKLLADGLNVPTLPQFEILANETMSISASNHTGPWVLKPRNGIASQYVAFCKDNNAVIDALDRVPSEIRKQTQFMIEPFVEGQNLTLLIIEGFEIRNMSIFEE